MRLSRDLMSVCALNVVAGCRMRVDAIGQITGGVIVCFLLPAAFAVLSLESTNTPN